MIHTENNGTPDYLGSGNRRIHTPTLGVVEINRVMNSNRGVSLRLPFAFVFRCLLCSSGAGDDISTDHPRSYKLRLAMNRYQEYFDNPPPQLTELQRVAATLEGRRRRENYIKKHPTEESKNLAPTGWDEPIEPKKRRRRR